MKIILILIGAFLGLSWGACAAENDNLGSGALCKKCAGKGFITNIGRCGECARDTSSGAFKLCQACGKKLGKCQACGAALPAPAEKKPEDPVKNNAGEAKRPLTEFEDANFGVHFGHSAALSTEYNPHGGADRVMIVWNGKTLGGLKIGKKPPAMSTEEFIASGKDHYKEKYNASSVTHSMYKSKDSYEFHYFKVEFELKEQRYVLERFVYLREDRGAVAEASKPSVKPTTEASRGSSDIAASLMAEISGSFSFEFLFPVADYDQLKPEIRTVIDTFRIVEKSSNAKLETR